MTSNPQEKASWHIARVGKVTASAVHKIVRRTAKDKPYAAYGDYQSELILERLTGKAADHFVSAAMETGTLREPEAALAYTMETGRKVEFSDFVDHATVARSGASPDRLVGENGLLEIKCPQPKAHMDFLMTETVPVEYYWQMQWQMCCTGRQWCDLMYYNPDFPPHLQTRTVRVERNAMDILNAESLVLIFDQECEAQIEALNKSESVEAAA